MEKFLKDTNCQTDSLEIPKVRWEGDKVGRGRCSLWPFLWSIEMGLFPPILDLFQN